MPKRYIPNDKWSRRAAEEGYRARSVYKLMELDDKFHIIRSGMTVLDLGAAPGSWLQYAAEEVGSKGRVIGIDLTEIAPIDNVETYVENITNIEAIQKIVPETVDLIISDLAPKTSGIRDVDQWKSIELSQAVVETAQQILRPGGKCILKVLRGADFDDFITECKEKWKKVKITSVQASRDRSNEIYVILWK
ncbi:23S rRNA methyltransferase [Candidatus Peregrinibacteria bacterium CG10_big_fil_rev_8_21_14_0_10_42_8]|nr:MAG: 23S rRNA methyltransferase [Candidatus Peregrinibacteria bacterium CG10_big_fil_rev_8_21_14_0_10_42_8]